MANPASPTEHKTEKEEALLLIKQLRKRSMHVPVNEVECVDRGEPCGLASCHICREMLHHHAIDRLFARYDTSLGIQCTTITPAYGRVELDDLEGFNPDAFLEKIRRQLRNTIPPGTPCRRPSELPAAGCDPFQLLREAWLKCWSDGPSELASITPMSLNRLTNI